MYCIQYVLVTKKSVNMMEIVEKNNAITISCCFELFMLAPLTKGYNKKKYKENPIIFHEYKRRCFMH